MEKDKLTELLAKYNEGVADPAEIQLIEKLIESGELDLVQLQSLRALDEQFGKVKDEVPSMAQDSRFYQMLASEKARAKAREVSSLAWLDLKFLMPRLAFAFSLVLFGGVGGFLLNSPKNQEVTELTQQVTDLKEMMMISLLEKESAAERLKAVSLTQEINDPSQQVTQALFETLNADPNINVRLAALEALQGYAKQPKVREGLIRSITKQDSPLVQVALAELMLALQEKSSVTELKKVLDQQKTPKEVKDKIKKTIDVLI